jgi:hypothetical protein
VPSNYSALHYGGFFAFSPSDPKLDGLISHHDINCAVSQPNALYGTRYNFDQPDLLPFFAVNGTGVATAGRPTAFTFVALAIKPLDMPFAFTTVSLKGYKASNETVAWSVDFPAGFHDVLNVTMKTFSSSDWHHLTKMEVWADFHNGDETLDWEFCLDNLEVTFEDI